MIKNSVNPMLSPKPVTSLIDAFFNRGIHEFIGGDFYFHQPAVNIAELEDRFQIDLAAPGLVKSDFQLKVEDKHLIVSAEKQNSSEPTENEKFSRREFNYSRFTRSFQLPEAADQDQISAQYINGVLKITLPKKEAAIAKGPRTIEIV